MCTVLQPYDVGILVGFGQNHYFVKLGVCIKEEFELSFLLNICLFSRLFQECSLLFPFLQIELCCFQNILEEVVKKPDFL